MSKKALSVVVVCLLSCAYFYIVKMFPKQACQHNNLAKSVIDRAGYNLTILMYTCNNTEGTYVDFEINTDTFDRYQNVGMVLTATLKNQQEKKQNKQSDMNSTIIYNTLIQEFRECTFDVGAEEEGSGKRFAVLEFKGKIQNIQLMYVQQQFEKIYRAQIKQLKENMQKKEYDLTKEINNLKNNLTLVNGNTKLQNENMQKKIDSMQKIEDDLKQEINNLRNNLTIVNRNTKLQNENMQKSFDSMQKIEDDLKQEISNQKNMLANLQVIFEKELQIIAVHNTFQSVLFPILNDDFRQLIDYFGTPKIKAELLYRGTRDGFVPADFHRMCDGKGPTLVLVRKSDNVKVFGGYASSSWSSNNQWAASPGSFLFSFISGFKYLITQNPQYAIYNAANHGPIFGGNNGGNDFLIGNQKTGVSTLVNTYSREGLKNNFELTGTQEFTIVEIEVYSINTD